MVAETVNSEVREVGRPARFAHLRGVSVRRGDVVAMVLIATIVTLSLAFRATSDDQPLALLLLGLSIPPLFLRDHRPFLALAMATIARCILPDDDALLFPALAVLYSLAATQRRQTAVVAAGAVILASAVAGAAWGHNNEHGRVLGYALGTFALCSAAVALGLYGGARARVLEALRERAERADREKELLAERAVAEERVRIAQELHDVVAHNVSLMLVQAQALGATVDDERVAESTRAIADLGRQAMAEMSRTLTLLRAGDIGAAELAPQPGLANLDRLLDQSRAAGLDAELMIEGNPRPLAQAIDVSAFRIIQEALTNVIKHAGGAHTRVTLSYGAVALRLTIADSGGGDTGNGSERPSEGHGLIGMRERATLFGGTLSAKQRPGHGFAVVATLPYSGADS